MSRLHHTQHLASHTCTHTAIRATPTHQPHPSLAHTSTILSHHTTTLSRHSYPSASPSPPNNTLPLLPLPSAYPWYPTQPYPVSYRSHPHSHKHQHPPTIPNTSSDAIPSPTQPPSPPRQASPSHPIPTPPTPPPLLSQPTLPPTSHSHPH
ncbi:hypothetical protein Pcinc_029010 [Petrolisthes cinctipes]|uniref:Uncharacterized protein n=1 Tax=Petrolisthes cinctipes TaxID=88211 RepID=A0AAE1F0Y3_PETCI|nr:hypothetical protein Pcinc_029010 [Petrolisthes cinctipes]